MFFKVLQYRGAALIMLSTRRITSAASAALKRTCRFTGETFSYIQHCHISSGTFLHVQSRSCIAFTMGSSELCHQIYTVIACIVYFIIIYFIYFISILKCSQCSHLSLQIINSNSMDNLKL